MTSNQKFSVDCQQCPRLSSFLAKNRKKFNDYYNLPVPSQGPISSRLLVVGLAPGLHGANKTGVPFAGDHSGTMLHRHLFNAGFIPQGISKMKGRSPSLNEVRITNAVRCVPPKNRPLAAEINNCQRFLGNEIENLGKKSAILALGRIAHGSIIKSIGLNLNSHQFKHGRIYDLGGDLRLWDSYHCSRYNVNTGRLTEKMFHIIFHQIKIYLSHANDL